MAATASHLLGLLVSSSVIMTIYRPTPLVPDVFVLHFCYDEAQMSYITSLWLLSPPLWSKEKSPQQTWVFDMTLWTDFTWIALAVWDNHGHFC